MYLFDDLNGPDVCRVAKVISEATQCEMFKIYADLSATEGKVYNSIIDFWVFAGKTDHAFLQSDFYTKVKQFFATQHTSKSLFSDLVTKTNAKVIKGKRVMLSLATLSSLYYTAAESSISDRDDKKKIKSIKAQAPYCDRLNIQVPLIVKSLFGHVGFKDSDSEKMELYLLGQPRINRNIDIYGRLLSHDERQTPGLCSMFYKEDSALFKQKVSSQTVCCTYYELRNEKDLSQFDNAQKSKHSHLHPQIRETTGSSESSMDDNTKYFNTNSVTSQMRLKPLLDYYKMLTVSTKWQFSANFHN